MSIRPLLKRARAVLYRLKTDEAERQSVEQSVEQSTVEKSKHDPIVESTVAGNDTQGDPGRPQDGLQHGVSDVEAITLTWSKTTLILVFVKYVFVLIWSLMGRPCPNREPRKFPVN